MNKALLLALLSGLCSAFLSLLIFGPAPLIGMGLVFGASIASISAAFGALSMLYVAGGVDTLLYLGTTAIPSAITIWIAFKSSETGSRPDCGKILATISVFGLLVISFITIDILSIGTWIETQVEKTFGQFFSQLQLGSNPEQKQHAANAYKLMVHYASSIAPAGLAIVAFIILVLNGVFVERILFHSDKSTLRRPHYSSTKLPNWLCVLFFTSIIACFFPNFLGKLGLNSAIFLSFPFLLAGLAVIHTLSRRSDRKKSILFGVYIALFVLGVLFGLLFVLAGCLAFLGAVEQWAGLRRRFGPDQSISKEDE